MKNFRCLSCESALFFLGFVSEKSFGSSSYNKEFSLERFTVSLAEIYLYETVNNELNTNNRTFEFQIKQLNIMTNAKKENPNHQTFNQ